MPRLQPPAGFMTSKQARERLGVSDTWLRKRVADRILTKYGSTTQKIKPFYKEDEIEALYHARQVFDDTDSGPSTFEIATEEDMPAIMDIDTRTFGSPAASFDVCMSWFRRNPHSFYVLKNGSGIVRGYASLIPMAKIFIDQFIHDQLEAENIKPEMVDQYTSHKPLDIYVMAIAIDSDCSTKEKRRYGQRMISGLLAFLYGLAEEGVEITSITARSHKPDGLNLLKKIGFTQLRSPVPGHELFTVNIPESGIPFFLMYSERLDRWKEENGNKAV